MFKNSIVSFLHGLKNPLNVIIGFVRLPNNDEYNEMNYKLYFRMIMEGCEQLSETVIEIVTYYREGKETGLKIGNVDINLLIAELFRFYGPVAHDKGLLLRCNAVCKFPHSIIRTDGQKLRCILENLLGNAIKYTEKGEIAYGYESDGDKWVTFYVHDTGIGLHEEDTARVFDLFFRSDDARTIARALGGDLTLFSEPGKGSILSFSIPVAHSNYGNRELLSIAYAKEKIMGNI